jgi:Flp pilus assembly protein TadB
MQFFFLKKETKTWVRGLFHHRRSIEDLNEQELMDAVSRFISYRHRLPSRLKNFEHGVRATTTLINILFWLWVGMGIVIYYRHFDSYTIIMEVAALTVTVAAIAYILRYARERSAELYSQQMFSPVWQ